MDSDPSKSKVVVWDLFQVWYSQNWFFSRKNIHMYHRFGIGLLIARKKMFNKTFYRQTKVFILLYFHQEYENCIMIFSDRSYLFARNFGDVLSVGDRFTLIWTGAALFLFIHEEHWLILQSSVIIKQGCIFHSFLLCFNMFYDRTTVPSRMYSSSFVSFSYMRNTD